MPIPISEVARRADLFFLSASPIHEAMRRLNQTLVDMKIPFAVAGAMAANAHGHRRTTADVDILIRGEDLQRFKEQHIGRGWVNKFEGSKNFRDGVAGVDVDALIAGQFPGDGKPKPIAFPDPIDVAETHEDGIPYISLPTLLTLKIASGMTAAHRPRDLDDAIQLIRINQLDRDFAAGLNPFVQEKFVELWQASKIEDDY
ncbi:MAG: hypothetical protein AAF958_03575 [Planctomycetota bacterium]